ncbi:hypothetical protein D3C73_1008520 [compost metagenome]
MPAAQLGNDARGEGTHQGRNHPGCGECGKDFGVQCRRVYAGHQYIEGHGHRATTETLDQPSQHQHFHGSGHSGDQQASHEQGHGGVQRRSRTPTI